MARKRVAVQDPQGNLVNHLTHPQAFQLVLDDQAEWLDKYRIIRLLDTKVAPRGKNDRFDDVWRIKPSAGVPVWQMQT